MSVIIVSAKKPYYEVKVRAAKFLISNFVTNNLNIVHLKIKRVKVYFSGPTPNQIKKNSK